jgi:hypothetical protein
MWHGRLFEATSVSIGRGAPILACSASFVYIGLTEGNLDTATVFSAFAAYQALRLPMIMIPFCFITVSNMMVSFARITEYLLLPERALVPPIDSEKHADTVAALENCTFEWPTEVRQHNN